MLKERVIEKAFNKVSAFNTFYGLDKELRTRVAKNSMKAYLDRRHVEASDEEIEACAARNISAMDNVEHQYGDLLKIAYGWN